MGFTTLQNQSLPKLKRMPVSMTHDERLFLSYDKSNKLSNILKSGAWAGKRCFIIGGGESLIGFDFSKLNGELSIGVNKTFIYHNSTINYSMDEDFYDQIHGGTLDTEGVSVLDRWNSFEGVRVFLCPMHLKRKYGPEVYTVKRILRPFVSKNLDEGIWAGNNSGFGALMLSVLLGSSDVYLLGFDLKVENHTHWHGGYPKQDIEKAKNKCSKFFKDFIEIAPKLLAMGIKVTNLNPNSALNCFPKIDMSKVL